MFISPIKGPAFITSTYTEHLASGRPGGVDLVYAYIPSLGADLVAVCDGIITQEGIDQYGGHWLNLAGGGFMFQYVHNDKHIFYGSELTKLKPSQTFVKNVEVKAGDTIATLGSTGWSTGPHLHLTAFSNGSIIDPLNVINLYNYMQKIFITETDFVNLQTNKSDLEQKNENRDIFANILKDKVETIIWNDFISSFRFVNNNTKTDIDIYWQHILAVQELLAQRNNLKIANTEINKLRAKNKSD